MATEEQIQAVKAGRELSTMEKIPNPSVPLPAHLAFVSHITSSIHTVVYTPLGIYPFCRSSSMDKYC